jgi:hypothetical protein
MFYSVVLLDGNELHCLSLEDVQDLFFKRQLNQDSLVCTAEEGQWQMLKRMFDLSQWISSGASQADAQPNYQSQTNPFEQMIPVNPSNNFEPALNPADQPVTFNQFPQTTPNNFGQNTSNGYSQNNQTETYYQAETNQTNYNFQNNQTNYAPSKYNNPAGSYNYAPNYSNNNSAASGQRSGLRLAAGFLLTSLLLNVGFLILGATLQESFGDNSTAYNNGQKFGSTIPLLINILLAVRLWKTETGESGRLWTLTLTYLGFILIGLVIPVFMLKSGNPMIGGVFFVLCFFYFLGIALVLHGKESPSTSRLIVGTASFAIYALMMLGTLSLAVVGKFALEMAKMPNSSQFEKYKIEGKEYEDKITGAKVLLPEGWSMLKTDNPVMRTPTARMIAVDQGGKRLTMLEVVPVPGNLDMKKQNPALILDKLADNVVGALNQEVMKNGGIGGRDEFKEVTRLSINIGKHPAKLLVFDKVERGEKVKGHLIITYDELTFYVLHSWCPASEYEQAQNDFTFFEKNFTVPEKINSSFTQSADNDKKP